MILNAKIHLLIIYSKQLFMMSIILDLTLQSTIPGEIISLLDEETPILQGKNDDLMNECSNKKQSKFQTPPRNKKIHSYMQLGFDNDDFGYNP